MFIANHLLQMILCIMLLAGPTSAASPKRSPSPTPTPITTQDPSNIGNEGEAKNSPTPAFSISPSPSPTTLLGDSSLLAGAIQASATVVAVLFGFLLSTFAERRAWNRRKVEQLREKQLTALLEFLSGIQQYIELSQNILIELKLSIDSLPKPEERRAGRAAVLEATRSNLKAQVSKWMKEMDDYKRNAFLRITELRFLRIRENGLKLSTDCLKYSAAMIEVLKGIHAEPPQNDVKDFEDTLQTLISMSDALTRSAIDSLHE